MQVDDPGTQAASSLEDKMSQVSNTQMNEWMKNEIVKWIKTYTNERERERERERLQVTKDWLDKRLNIQTKYYAPYFGEETTKKTLLMIFLIVSLFIIMGLCSSSFVVRVNMFISRTTEAIFTIFGM